MVLGCYRVKGKDWYSLLVSSVTRDGKGPRRSLSGTRSHYMVHKNDGNGVSSGGRESLRGQRGSMRGLVTLKDCVSRAVWVLNASLIVWSDPRRGY